MADLLDRKTQQRYARRNKGQMRLRNQQYKSGMSPEDRVFSGLKSINDTAEGVGEMTKMILSGAGAEVLAGLGGIQALALTQDPAKATQAINKIQEEFTYQPKGETAQGWLQSAAPTMQKAGSWIDEKAANIERDYGIPRELVKVVPQMVAEVLPGGAVLGAMNKVAKRIPVPSRFRQSGSIAGVHANTHNPKAKQMAETMRDSGASREEIWKATGDQYGQPSYFDPVI